MADDKHWQLKAEGNPARKGLPALKQPTSKKAVAVRLYESDDALLRCLEEAPDVRSAALMSALERARTELVRTPTHTLIDTPVQIPIADLIAMTRALMSRLR